MLPKETKLKYTLPSSKNDVKKRTYRKSMCTNFPKLFLSGKAMNPHLINKKNEKKFLIRKYTAVIKENRNNNGNLVSKNDNKINNTKSYKNKQKTKKAMRQLEKIIYNKFYSNYTKYYYDVNKTTDDNENVKMSIYDYYQSNKIISNQKCRTKVIFQEYKYYFNINEYIIEYYIIKECNIMLKFLLFFIYSRDIYVFNKSEDKKRNKINIFKNFVRIIQQKIEKIDVYKISILNQIIQNIKDINNKSIKRESIIHNINLKNITQNKAIKYFLGNIDDLNILKDYCNYIPILLNIPSIKLNSFLPNSFCFGYKINIYISNYLSKLRAKKLIDIQKKIRYKNEIIKTLSKSPLTNRKNNYNKSFYNKSFYNENIKKNEGISFATIENLDDKLEDNKYLDYSYNINNNQNILKREFYDPEIKDIEIFINNFNNYNKRNTKKVKSIKFSIDIKDKKEKDALLNKMLKIKMNRSLSQRNLNNKNGNLNNKFNNNIFSSRQSQHNQNNNNHYSILKNNNRKLSFQNSKIDKTSLDEKKIMIKSIKKKNIIDNKNQKSINKVKSLNIIRKYSFKKKSHNNCSFKDINYILSPNKNHYMINKDSLSLIPSYSAPIRKIKNNKSINKMNNNILVVNKNSFSSLSSKRFSIRKSNSTISSNNNNIKKENNKKNKFKDINQFILDLLQKSNKYSIKNILLGNIESINKDPNNKFSIEFKNYFRRRIFRYFPPKYFEIDNNIWKDGEYRDSIYKSNYHYNLLMMRIQKQIQRNKDKYKNLLQKEVNIRQISKSADIYI